MNCPKCNSINIKLISITHPKVFECKDCGHVFMKSIKALIDE